MLEIFALRTGVVTAADAVLPRLSALSAEAIGAAHPISSNVSSPTSTRRMKQLLEITA
jgi:hypothetical protein